MFKHVIILLAFLVLTPLCFASLDDDLERLQVEIESFVDTSNEDNLIVMGDYASVSEKAMLQAMKFKFSQINEMRIVTEQDLLDENTEGKTLIFIGGPMKNQQAAVRYNNENYQQRESVFTGGSVLFLESENSKAMIFSDFRGYENIPHTAARKSPLNKFVPTYLVPAVATVIGLSLYWLIPFLLKFVAKVLSFMNSIKLMSFVRKKEIKEKYVGFKVGGIRVKIREWIAILGAATVFACSLGYLYLSPQLNLQFFFILTVIVNFIVYGIRHFVRLYFDKHHKIHSEYMIWIWGALITAFTAWLGNVFALAGYVVKSDDEDDKEYQGKNAFIVNLVTFAFFGLLFFLNFKAPNLIFQMTMLLALSITYLQMMPFKPFDGKNIYAWNKAVWWVFFIILTAIYIPINLVI